MLSIVFKSTSSTPEDRKINLRLISLRDGAVRRTFSPSQALLAIAFEVWFDGSGYVTTVLAAVAPFPQLNHGAELAFTDAIRASKAWHTALPR